MKRHVMLSAAYQPSLDGAIDKVMLDAARGDIPEWGLADCRPGEMLRITIERVQPKAEIKLVRTPGRTFEDVRSERNKRMGR